MMRSTLRSISHLAIQMSNNNPGCCVNGVRLIAVGVIYLKIYHIFFTPILTAAYKRSEADRHLLVIDEVVAKNVKLIYEMYKNHESARHIADLLNEKEILTPQSYYYDSIGKVNPYTQNSKSWGSAAIINLLKNQVYIGHMVQSKKAVQSFKSKKVVELPPEMWVTVENTHEPIVEEETFKAVQFLMAQNKNKRPKKSHGEVSLFSNILFCKDCGAKMVLSTTQKGAKIDRYYRYYRCYNYVQHTKTACSSHRITLATLSEAILADIRYHAKLAKADEENFVKKLHKISMKEKNQEISDCRRKELIAKNRLTEVDGLIQKTFEKNCDGIISDSMLKDLLQKYESEKQSLHEQLEKIRLDLLNAESQTTCIEKEVKNLIKYAEITELNRSIVTSLIQSIHISQPSKVDGKRKYEFDICYKFQKQNGTKKETVSDNTIPLKAV